MRVVSRACAHAASAADLTHAQMTDHNAFAILNSILCHVPASKFPEFLPVLTNAALDRYTSA
jgi:hypothetical protein